jgi:nucleolar protein 15
MGMRDKKRNQRSMLSRHSDGPKTGEEKDFPVACFPLNQIKEPENMATILYIRHIPHGFYENQMQREAVCV